MQSKPMGLGQPGSHLLILFHRVKAFYPPAQILRDGKITLTFKKL